MKKAVSAFCMMLALLVFAAVSQAAGLNKIAPEELRAMMNDGKPMVIVDVREPELFTKAHIPGAINIPYDESHSRILKELNPRDRIVFVCHGGPMGDELGEILVKNGYGSVYNLKGGMKYWTGPFAK